MLIVIMERLKKGKRILKKNKFDKLLGRLIKITREK